MADEEKREEEHDDKGEHKDEGAKKHEPTHEETKAELDRTRDALKKANGEAAKHRKELDGYKKAEQDKKDADLSEVEKLKKGHAEKDEKLSKAHRDLHHERVSHAVQLGALAMDFHDPDDAMRPEVLNSIETDEDGNVDRKSVKTALEKLAKDKPHLVRSADDDKKRGRERDSRDGSPPGRESSRRPKPDQGDDRQREERVQRSTGRYII